MAVSCIASFALREKERQSFMVYVTDILRASVSWERPPHRWWDVVHPPKVEPFDHIIERLKDEGVTFE